MCVSLKSCISFSLSEQKTSTPTDVCSNYSRSSLLIHAPEYKSHTIPTEAEHYDGTASCGNSCPSTRSCCYGGFTNLFKHFPWLLTFGFAYLQQIPDPYLAMLWDFSFGAGSIDQHPFVSTVHRFARISGRPNLRQGIASPLPYGESIRFFGLIVENTGTNMEYDIELTDVSSEQSATTASLCREYLDMDTVLTGPFDLPIDQSVEFELSARAMSSALVGKTCTATFNVVNVDVGAMTENINLTFEIIADPSSSSNAVCGYSDWGEWSETCPCCSTSDLIVIDIVETAGALSRSAGSYFSDSAGGAVARGSALKAASTELATLASRISESATLREPCAAFIDEVDSNNDGSVSVAETRMALQALKRWAGSGTSLARATAEPSSDPALVCTRECDVLWRFGSTCVDTVQTKSCRSCGNVFDDNGLVNLSPIINVLVTS